MANWRRAFQGAALGISDLAGQQASALITDRVAQKREARMAKYRQADVADQRQYQDGVRAEGQDFQREVMGVQGDAAAKQAEITRADKLTDAETKRQHDIAMLERKAALGIDKGTTVNVEADRIPTRQDNRAAKLGDLLAANDAERMSTVSTMVDAAPAIEDSLNVMEELSSAFTTGKIPELVATGGRYFGTDAAAALDTWEAAAGPLILSQASTLAGVLSETDMRIVISGVANFGKDPAANKVAIDLMRKGIERARENHNSMESYLQENPSLDGWRAPNMQGGVQRTPGATDGTRPADNPVGVIQSFDEWDAAN